MRARRQGRCRLALIHGATQGSMHTARSRYQRREVGNSGSEAHCGTLVPHFVPHFASRPHELGKTWRIWLPVSEAYPFDYEIDQKSALLARWALFCTAVREIRSNCCTMRTSTSANRCFFDGAKRPSLGPVAGHRARSQSVSNNKQHSDCARGPAQLGRGYLVSHSK